MKAHLFGTSPYLPDAGVITADQLHIQTGGNTGNLMFAHSVTRMLDIPPESISWSNNVQHLNPKTNRLVMPLANQLGPHVDLKKLAETLRSVEVPLVGIGLGAQGPITGPVIDSIPEGSWEWVRVLVEKAPSKAPNLALRGQSTYDMLAEKGFGSNCVVTGCPSNFINPSPYLGREIYRRRSNGIRKIAVAAGNPFLAQFRVLEQCLVELVNSSNGIYICQHPIDMLRLSKGEAGAITHEYYQLYRNYIAPYLSDDQFLLWFKNNAHAFSSVPEWLATMKRYDLVIGTRIHGIMAGIQAGVPSLCLCIDSRTLELCQTMNIPHLDANNYKNGIGLYEIDNALRDWNWRNYDDNRRNLADVFSKFFSDNDIPAKGSVKKLTEGFQSLANLRKKRQDCNDTHQVSTASVGNKYDHIFLTISKHLNVRPVKILSYGCSDGYEPNDLANQFFTTSLVFGCDIDEVALDIARKTNQHPARVRILDFNQEILAQEGPFDLIIAMSVLCRWPDTQNVENASKVYSFDKFSTALKDLVGLLSPNGLICVYNSNYRVMDVDLCGALEPVALKGLPKVQAVRIFDVDGVPLKEQIVDNIIFKKI